MSSRLGSVVDGIASGRVPRLLGVEISRKPITGIAACCARAASGHTVALTASPMTPRGMALRWTATAMLEAEKSFRRLKAHKQLPVLRAALLRHQQALLGDKLIASKNLVA